MPVKRQLSAPADVLTNRRNERQSVERTSIPPLGQKLKNIPLTSYRVAPLPGPDVTGNRMTHAKIPSSLFPEQDCNSSARHMEPIGCQSAVVGADGG